jgi:hypothetical protein
VVIRLPPPLSPYTHTHRVVEAWESAKKWLRGVNALLEEVNEEVERENRKYDSHFSGCQRIAHTPTMYHKVSCFFAIIFLGSIELTHKDNIPRGFLCL